MVGLTWAGLVTPLLYRHTHLWAPLAPQPGVHSGAILAPHGPAHRPHPRQLPVLLHLRGNPLPEELCSGSKRYICSRLVPTLHGNTLVSKLSE